MCSGLLSSLKSSLLGRNGPSLHEEYSALGVRRAAIEKEKESLKASGSPEGSRVLELEKELAINKDRCEYLEHVLKLKTVDQEVKEDLSLLAKAELGKKGK